MTTLPNPNTILREAAAPLLTRAAAKMRADAQAAPYRPGRWSVDVSTLADSARLLGPAYDALTATWQQAAYVHAMSPDVGTYLAHVLDNAARDCTTRNPDTALIALALAYLGELDTPAPAAAPDAPALPAVIVTTPAADTEAAPPRVGTPVLEAALRWFYETEQPADAVISHHGLSFPPLTGNRTVRLVPTGREGLPTIFIDVTNVRYARVRGEEVTANPLDPGEINRVVRLLTKLGAQVTATWHGGGGRVSGSISLARPAPPDPAESRQPLPRRMPRAQQGRLLPVRLEERDGRRQALLGAHPRNLPGRGRGARVRAGGPQQQGQRDHVHAGAPRARGGLRGQ